MKSSQVATSKLLKKFFMIGFVVFIGKYEVFFGIIGCWKIEEVLSAALVVGWKKEQLIEEHLAGYPIIFLWGVGVGRGGGVKQRRGKLHYFTKIQGTLLKLGVRGPLSYTIFGPPPEAVGTFKFASVRAFVRSSVCPYILDLIIRS